MKLKSLIIIWACYVIASVAFFGLILWVAWHFIKKFW